MKHYVIEIETTAEGTAKQITEKATLDEAKALYHQVLASVYANDKVTYALVMIINDKGFCEVMERVPTPQSEE
jgi:hypothetical protein